MKKFRRETGHFVENKKERTKKVNLFPLLSLVKLMMFSSSSFSLYLSRKLKKKRGEDNNSGRHR
jgi:hypothetical protein